MKRPRFELVEGWGVGQSGWTHGDVSSVCLDTAGRVHLFCRGPRPVLTFDIDGVLVDSFAVQLTGRAHGLLVLDETYILIDDTSHSVSVFDRSGQFQRHVGSSAVPRAGEPFNRPTNAALGPDGHLYVADGYVNAKVHVFTVGGEPVRSWGTRGSGPGQFQLVHDLAFHPDGRLFVADSDNERLQIFSPDGTYLGQWLDVQRPRALAVGGDGLVFIGEFPWAAGQTSARRGARRAAEPARLSIFTPDGELLARWGASPDDPLGGHLVAPHSLAVDDEGSLYVAEVPASFLGAAAAATAPRLRKLRRL